MNRNVAATLRDDHKLQHIVWEPPVPEARRQLDRLAVGFGRVYDEGELMWLAEALQEVVKLKREKRSKS